MQSTQNLEFGAKTDVLGDAPASTQTSQSLTLRCTAWWSVLLG